MKTLTKIAVSKMNDGDWAAASPARGRRHQERPLCWRISNTVVEGLPAFLWHVSRRRPGPFRPN